MNKDTLQSLLNKQKEGTLTAQEQQQLDDWESALEREEGLMELYDDAEQHDVKQRVWDHITKRTAEPGKLIPIFSGRRKISAIKMSWVRYAAALIIIAGMATFFLWTDSHQPAPALTVTPPATPVNDIPAPTGSHATLTLAGGRQIFLDSAVNGTLATQGNVNIRMTNDGRIVYTGNAQSNVPAYNTLTVPRGSQIASIILSDGTQIFLNAASSLTYPVSFSGNERRVSIVGEAYFEVAHDPSKKFVVTSGDITTEVLGTHFNINTYSDERVKKVTLLEGSVKVIAGTSNLVITPGNQAALENGHMALNSSVDVDQVMAWKNGVFNFNNASCETVMRQLARWYDMDVIYPKGVPPIMFGGEIQKTLSLAEMLDVLGAVGVKFEINNKQVIVLP